MVIINPADQTFRRWTDGLVSKHTTQRHLSLGVGKSHFPSIIFWSLYLGVFIKIELYSDSVIKSLDSFGRLSLDETRLTRTPALHDRHELRSSVEKGDHPFPHLTRTSSYVDRNVRTSELNSDHEGLEWRLERGNCYIRTD